MQLITAPLHLHMLKEFTGGLTIPPKQKVLKKKNGHSSNVFVMKLVTVFTALLKLENNRKAQAPRFAPTSKCSEVKKRVVFPFIHFRLFNLEGLGAGARHRPNSIKLILLYFLKVLKNRISLIFVMPPDFAYTDKIFLLLLDMLCHLRFLKDK
jgi:hypothetical protein